MYRSENFNNFGQKLNFTDPEEGWSEERKTSFMENHRNMICKKIYLFSDPKLAPKSVSWV